MIRTILLLIIMNALNFLDYLQTIYAIQYLGMSVELNPFMRFLFEHNCAGVVKLGALIILSVYFLFDITRDRTRIWKPCFTTLLLFILVMRNFIELKSMGLLW